MKKGLLILIAFFICIFEVKASDSYFMWHNSIDNAYTTSYDGMISNEVGKYQNDTIESLGEHKIKLSNFNAYDVILYEETTWELNGDNVINFIEESSNSIINLKGNGVLRFQEIGLSMTDMLNSKSSNLEERLKTYLVGEYTLSIEENFIVLRLNSSDLVSDNNEEQTKTLSFENKGFNITIKSASKVPVGTVFIAENKLDTLKDEVNEKLTNEEIKYIYDFKLQDGGKNIEPTEEVEVSVELDNGDYIVYYYNENKELEKLDSKYENSCLTFKTIHFSNYIITSPKEEVNVEEEKKDTPKKDSTLMICISILIISLITLVIIIITGKRK